MITFSVFNTTALQSNNNLHNIIPSHSGSASHEPYQKKSKMTDSSIRAIGWLSHGDAL